MLGNDRLIELGHVCFPRMIATIYKDPLAEVKKKTKNKKISTQIQD